MTKQTNLNYLFIDQAPNFAHLITTEPQTKSDFMEKVKNTYSLSNPKTKLFYLSVQKSDFETIRLNQAQTEILFNQ